MESKWTDKSYHWILAYLLAFIMLGLRCDFKFDAFMIGVLLVVYILFTYAWVNIQRMTIDSDSIRIYRLIGKDECISLKDATKIKIENMPWQIAKSYVIFIYTPEKIYELAPGCFDVEKLNNYLSKLCQEKGIEYYFNK